MGRMSFIVSTLLAFSLAATVLAAALLVGLFPTSPGGGVGSTTRPSFSAQPFPSSVAVTSPTPVLTVAPTIEPPTTAPPSGGTTYTVKPGDALSLIGEKFGIPWQLIAEANGIEGPAYVIVPGMELIIPGLPQATAGSDVYVVQSGDTITGIAQQLGIDPTTLADFNNIADWNTIAVGDLLYIPSDANATPLPLATP